MPGWWGGFGEGGEASGGWGEEGYFAGGEGGEGEGGEGRFEETRFGCYDEFLVERGDGEVGGYVGGEVG